LGVRRICAAVCGIALTLGALGCREAISPPPQATISEIEPSGRPAKGPNCSMPIRRSEPMTDYRKVAIIEALGSRYASESDVMPVVIRKACETGADAILILASKGQTSENMTGYYINAVAIVYEKGDKVITGSSPDSPPR
jgi:hypothetical protein